MLSHSIFLGNNRSEHQFIGDLVNLCKRHKISCGEPKDLTHLGPDLVSKDNFRIDLFTLCTAISHMAEVDLSSEQLLRLVARAFGGLGVSIEDPIMDLPQAASFAFINGYEAWSKRESGPDADPIRDEDRDRDRDPAPSRPGPTLYYSATSRAGSELETHDDPPPTTPPHRSIPANTPLENLTLGELRMYLEDLENRVSRIEPRLERIAQRRRLSSESLD
jgi:hypothetical protein